MYNTYTLSKQADSIAGLLLDIKAFTLNVDHPFTWTSGIKSPVYCDNRCINSNVEIREKVLAAFIEIAAQDFKDVEIIAGVATGGIPIAMLIAHTLKLPFIYVRPEKKAHGLMKQVEGSYEAGKKVLLIEDLVSTGISSAKALEGLKDAQLKIQGLISIMTYGFTAATEFLNKTLPNIKLFSLCDLNTILKVGVARGKFSKEDADEVLSFAKSPQSWG